MEVYIVTYEEIYPDCYNDSKEDRTKIAFVLADSFQNAYYKVDKRFKKEFESVKVVNITLESNASIIV